MQLGWIDFSKEDRQKALDVINLLSEQGAVDELGIGIVRDAFANYFFPGTSTIQTRAKYFLIVPYVLREAVDGRYGKDVNRILMGLDTSVVVIRTLIDKEFSCNRVSELIGTGEPYIYGETYIYPVAHPGYWGTSTRGEDNVIADWRRIRK